MDNPDDLSDEELLAMLTPRQLADLDRAIAGLMGPEGLDKVIPLQVTAQLYTMRAAERDPTSALAMLQMAAAMRRRAEVLAADRKPKTLE
ncbi:low temperature requirement protein A [Caulobacter soli]|uniref:low temperature requirement protein A n=1 Tax=Caulobacter soli TaxID=2708539 RepID=UPI0013EAC20C|nr:low temperature requirement protein A [Caulobacter soli]